ISSSFYHPESAYPLNRPSVSPRGAVAVPPCRALRAHCSRPAIRLPPPSHAPRSTLAGYFEALARQPVRADRIWKPHVEVFEQHHAFFVTRIGARDHRDADVGFARVVRHVRHVRRNIEKL